MGNLQTRDLQRVERSGLLPTESTDPIRYRTESNVPVRFYLVHRGAGLGPIITNNYVQQSPFAIVQKDWSVALPEMARRYPMRGESLEISCHGAEGILALDPELNFNSLSRFATAVRGLLRPNARVEILACRVVSFPVSLLIDAWRFQVRREADRKFLMAWLDEDSSQGEFRGQRGARLVFQPRETRLARQPISMDHARVARLAIESGFRCIGSSYNGPLFCSSMAKMLCCTVRASMASQPAAQTSDMGLNEFLSTSNYGTMPIGNWKGHVFDFFPHGGVRWVGCDVPRPVYVPLTPEFDGGLRQT